MPTTDTPAVVKRLQSVALELDGMADRIEELIDTNGAASDYETPILRDVLRRLRRAAGRERRRAEWKEDALK